MQNFWTKLTLAFKDPILRKRIGFTVIALIIFRVLAAIPIPSVDPANLERLLSSSQLLGFLNIFSGGGLSNLSIVMLGVGPFITGSIIIQLLTMMLPSWKALMHEEGEAGRLKLSQYSRLLGAPLAVLQAIGFIILLQSQNVLPHLDTFAFAVNVIIISAGSILLMWIGELISEFGIGNGVSLIIFAGIVSRLPISLVQNFQKLSASGAADLPFYIIVLVVAVLAVAGVVHVTEAERSVPVTYAKQVRGNKVYGGSSTYLPLRLNQSGVIPIIFALSILLFPQIIATALSKLSGHPTIVSIASWISGLMANQWFYGVVYFILVVLFTYFYTAVTFDPKMISENLQRNGAFIPGVRPGEHTQNHLGSIVTRITLVGAVFLGCVAVLPLIIQAFSPNGRDLSVAVGGTALLIVVSVVLDLLKKIDAQVAMREY